MNKDNQNQAILLTGNRTLLVDGLVSLALIVGIYIYSSLYVDFSIPPFEDAAMLMRYADHLAKGDGIVWNVGEAPVDGATDFLFMVSSAGLINLGATVGRAVRGLGYASHILSVLLIYWTCRYLWRANVWMSVLSALYLAVGTGLSYVAVYFGTPFFALAVTCTWILGLMLVHQSNESFWMSLAFSLAGLITGLIRPEGAILAILMFVSLILWRNPNRSRVLIATFISTFIIFGGAYFIWRWNYFGQPLPNPFYRKGGGLLYWDSFNASLLNTFRLSLPFFLAFLLGLRSKETAKLTGFFLLPIIGFAAAFVLISDETNYGARFQYATVPLVLLTWYPLVKELQIKAQPASPGGKDGGKSNWERIIFIAGAFSIFTALIYYAWQQNCSLTSFQRDCTTPYESDGRYDLGKVLSEYRDRNYVLATTEAGLLPYYSGWTTVDTWGLNDQWITQNGEVTEEYLDRYHPHVIAFHAHFSPLVPPKLTEPNLAQDWFRMTITLMNYAEKRGYLLAAIFGDSPYESHYYYVRPDFEDSARIYRQISTMTRYYWYYTGKKSINYANWQPTNE